MYFEFQFGERSERSQVDDLGFQQIETIVQSTCQKTRRIWRQFTFIVLYCPSSVQVCENLPQ